MGIVRAQRILRHCLARNHVGRSAGVQDRIVHPGIFQHMLPHELDSLEGDQDTVQRTASLLRGHSRMGFLPVERHPEIFQGHRLYIHTGLRRRVHHQRYVNVPEASVLLHDDLSAQRFLRRSTVYHDLIWLVAGKFPDTQGGSDRHRPLHLMTAAVSHG